MFSVSFEKGASGKFGFTDNEFPEVLFSPDRQVLSVSCAEEHIFLFFLGGGGGREGFHLQITLRRGHLLGDGPLSRLIGSIDRLKLMSQYIFLYLPESF